MAVHAAGKLVRALGRDLISDTELIDALFHSVMDCDLKQRLPSNTEVELGQIGRAEWPEFESRARDSGLSVEFLNIRIHA